MSLVCTLNEQCSGVCGEVSYREERLTLAERGRNGRFKNDDDDEDNNLLESTGTCPRRADVLK